LVFNWYPQTRLATFHKHNKTLYKLSKKKKTTLTAATTFTVKILHLIHDTQKDQSAKHNNVVWTLAPVCSLCTVCDPNKNDFTIL